MFPAIPPLLPAPSTLLPLLAETETVRLALQRRAAQTAFSIGVGVAFGSIVVQSYERYRARVLQSAVDVMSTNLAARLTGRVKRWIWRRRGPGTVARIGTIRPTPGPGDQLSSPAPGTGVAAARLTQIDGSRAKTFWGHEAQSGERCTSANITQASLQHRDVEVVDRTIRLAARDSKRPVGNEVNQRLVSRC